MLSFLKKYKISLTFIFMTLCLTMTTTWVVERLSIPGIISKGLTILVYAPFIAAIVWKLWDDIRSIRKKKPDVVTCLYYLFALYYAGLTVWRFFAGLQIKENLYYTIVLLGSVAAFLQLYSGRLADKDGEVRQNLIVIALYLVLYRVFYASIGVRFFEKQPINTNLLTGALGLLLPMLLNAMCEAKADKKQMILAGVAAFGALMIIVTTGARAIFLLSLMSVGVVLLCNVINWRGLVRMVALILSVTCVVTVLAACNYGTVRYALYRETGLNVSSLFGTEDKEIQTPVEDVEINEVQSSAENQIKQSDNMRGDLVKWGIEEIKKNPAFGTGNVLFRYVINEKRAFEQSSHNFVIESIICYGIVGLLLIGVMFACMLVKTDLYRKKNWYKWRDAVAMLLCVVYYFAFGFVQPTVYAPMICSLFVLLIYTFARDGLRDAQTEPAADKI